MNPWFLDRANDVYLTSSETFAEVRNIREGYGLGSG